MPKLLPFKYKLDTTKPHCISQLGPVIAGLQRIDFDQFSETLRAIIPVSDDYIKGTWPGFCNSPLRYCLERQPPELGYALINLACRLAQKEQS